VCPSRELARQTHDVIVTYCTVRAVYVRLHTHNTCSN